MRVLVTGSRDWSDGLRVWEELTAVKVRPLTVVEGACPTGADKYAYYWTLFRDDVISERHPAAWDELGKRAGMVRNRWMVDLGADLCLAFIRDYSVGSTNCANLAASVGIPTRIFREDQDGHYLGEDQ